MPLSARFYLWLALLVAGWVLASASSASAADGATDPAPRPLRSVQHALATGKAVMERAVTSLETTTSAASHAALRATDAVAGDGPARAVTSAVADPSASQPKPSAPVPVAKPRPASAGKLQPAATPRPGASAKPAVSQRPASSGSTATKAVTQRVTPMVAQPAAVVGAAERAVDHVVTTVPVVAAAVPEQRLQRVVGSVARPAMTGIHVVVDKLAVPAATGVVSSVGQVVRVLPPLPGLPPDGPTLPVPPAGVSVLVERGETPPPTASMSVGPVRTAGEDASSAAPLGTRDDPRGAGVGTPILGVAPTVADNLQSRGAPVVTSGVSSLGAMSALPSPRGFCADCPPGMPSSPSTPVGSSGASGHGDGSNSSQQAVPRAGDGSCIPGLSCLGVLAPEDDQLPTPPAFSPPTSPA